MLDAHTDHIIVLCAFRYAIKRPTHMTAIVVAWIKEHWHELSIHVQQLIATEIDEALDRGLIATRMEQQTWHTLAAWIEELPE